MTLGQWAWQLANWLRESRHVVAFTGAGMSTGSGIPDFRTPGIGLWEVRELVEAATLSAFRYFPERFYALLRPMLELALRAQPNPAHYALAEMEALGLVHTVITQNVDELHRRAGTQNLLELHGSFHTATCRQCHRRYPGRPVVESFVATGNIPRCPHCQGILKPDVILMEEQLPHATLYEARRTANRADLMLVLGSSLEVLPAAGLPMDALMNGARLVIINTGETYLDSRADLLIPFSVVDVLPRVLEALRSSSSPHE